MTNQERRERMAVIKKKLRESSFTHEDMAGDPVDRLMQRAVDYLAFRKFMETITGNRQGQ